MKRYLSLLAAAALLAPASASALQLAVQDDGAMGHDPAALFDAGHEFHATWLRAIVPIGDPSAADRIRSAHAQGFKVLLTIGGNGTHTLRPSAAGLLAYIATLPAADKYTVINEPNEVMGACQYRRTWMRVRRVLGSQLLWGDLSPTNPLSFTAKAARCGALPAHVGFALHPYQWSDPLAPGVFEGGIGNLSRAERFIHKTIGMSNDWWLDEFGYMAGPLKPPWRVCDEDAARMWPRAILQAERHHARMLNIYMASGVTWDMRPRELAWDAIRTAL